MAYTTIDDPSAHFHIQLYATNGTTNAITNDARAGNIKPDLLWQKMRTHDNGHNLLDTTRLANGESTMRLNSAATSIGADIVNDGMTSIDADGWTMNGNGSGGGTNEDGRNGITWQWKANGGTRTTNSESGNNQAGGYQANTTGGFSIVDYVGTGAAGNMAHGLGAVPHLIIIKNRDEAQDWLVYHHANTSAPETDILNLGTTAATYDNSTYWNDTVPTSTVFTTNTSADANKDSINYIAYIWTEKQGYSRFGGYTGNGSATIGTFVYTGFKPAFIILKRTDSTEDWLTYDTARDPYNRSGNETVLRPNTNAEEASYGSIDILSNGFKLYSSGGALNADAAKYVYIAFAKEPFVTSGGVPCTAR